MRRIAIFTFFFLFISLVSLGGSDKIKVLILSGRNNHDWKTTTPKLKSIYEKSGLFEVQVTENPETLKPDELKNYDVIVSNWNSFPETDVRWPAELEKALLNFVEEGGGFVTFHASTTCFYAWPEFKNISTGAWVEGTGHGQQSATEVLILKGKHPIIKGMQDFTIVDELWINAERNSSFEVLGTATNIELREKGIENQPAIMVKEYGKGHVFHTILGHEVKNMKNRNFQILMLRGTEWAATGKVKQKIKSINHDN